jgi:hypothetical protein
VRAGEALVNPPPLAWLATLDNGWVDLDFGAVIGIRRVYLPPDPLD